MIARITVNDVIPDEEPPSEIDPPPCDFQDTDEQESDEQTGMLFPKYYYYYYYIIIIILLLLYYYYYIILCPCHFFAILVSNVYIKPNRLFLHCYRLFYLFSLISDLCFAFALP